MLVLFVYLCYVCLNQARIGFSQCSHKEPVDIEVTRIVSSVTNTEYARALYAYKHIRSNDVRYVWP